uniref:Tetratricopeptide repeat n=1 Tax=Candidatus Kentrum eta TaxID=2126337 RepID=A0A450UCK4_9GAMM|nr:MAG: Tetratricopeptide repeat [Candidatus Kentron sp. H]VFJ91388.1 MAG: Tetratricopeptide repeat [Candidatus Kentron sp. H]VFJ98042.1 MAG: Tetratricopeptide repeat [Candidatus Kentron sp. H]
MITGTLHPHLREYFQGSVIPPWLRDFHDGPETALHDLLRGAAPLGHLSGSEPDELLLNWLRGFGPESPYARMLDSALVHWIDRHWGEPLLPGAHGNATLTAQAWVWALDTLAASPAMGPGGSAPPREYPLFRAAALLRERVRHDRHFLDAMTEGRARDPQGRAWVAMAMHQRDRQLLEEWWRLVSLPPDQPWYRGQHGLTGLGRLPPKDPARAGGFNKELAEGLGRLGEALWRRAEEGWLPEDVAYEEFSSLAHLAMAGSAFSDRWRGYWRHLVRRRKDEGFVAWLPIPPSELQKSVRGTGQWSEPDPAWADRAKALARDMRQPARATLEQADKLLAEQRHYADLTGDTHFLVRTACHFSGGVRAANPEQALAWAKMARATDPWNAYSWTNEAAALVALGKDTQALARYSEAILRFPNDAVARTGREGVLRALQQQGRTAGIKQAFPTPGETTRFDDPIRTEIGQNTASLSENQEGQTTTGYLSVASTEEPYVVMNREEITLLTTDAYLLRGWARRGGEDDPLLGTGVHRENARRLLEKLSTQSDRDPLAAGESGMLSLATGDRQRALDLLRAAVKRFPGSPRVRYALARAEREEAIAAADSSAMTTRQWKKLVRLDRHLLPLEWLGPLLLAARLSHSDGELQKNLGRLAVWLSPKFTRAGDKDGSGLPFYTWWGSTVYAFLFGAATVQDPSDPPDMQEIRGRLQGNYRELVTKEEELVYRHARR